MKKVLASVLLASSLFLHAPSSQADDFNCGEWNDVSSKHMDILTEICEYGLMQGHSESNYGYDAPLLRAELGVVVNRLHFGDDVYEDLGRLHDGYADYLSNLMNGYFTDIPSSSTYSNEWIIKAMYYSSIDLDIITGDGNQFPTTYRPLDSVNVVEAFKILYEAADEEDLLAAETSTHIDYNWNPWWEELMDHMEDEGVIVNLEVDDQTFWLGSPLTVSYSNFASSIDREDAAIFLYYMIEKGLIDEAKLEQRTNTECDSNDSCGV